MKGNMTYDILWQHLFCHLEKITKSTVSDMDSRSLCNLLLFGSCNLDANVNKMVIEEKTTFINKTKRFKFS